VTDQRAGGLSSRDDARAPREDGRCCLCSTVGPLTIGARGERMCADAVACIARVKVVIFRGR
jgi:hypothetical protein